MRYIMPLLILLLVLCTACDVIKSTQMEQAVAQALKDDPRTKSYSFEVGWQGEGKVLITGEVTSDADIAAVSEVAAAVQGVTTVMNRCSVPEPGSDMLQDTVVPSLAF